MQKYELTDDRVSCEGKTLRRIRALKGFGSVKAGDLGGWVESEDNLSQEGLCWITDEATVCDSAYVSGNVRVTDDAQVIGDVNLYGNLLVSGSALVKGTGNLEGDIQVTGILRLSQ